MKYVKLIARPNTWFKAGSEVWHYDCNPPAHLFRITLEEWQDALKDAGVNARGIRVIENEIEAQNVGMQVGEERWDGEWCSVDEFDVEITENID